MSVSLLSTKFHVPPARPNGVSRPRLIERLCKGLSNGAGDKYKEPSTAQGRLSVQAGPLESDQLPAGSQEASGGDST